MRILPRLLLPLLLGSLTGTAGVRAAETVDFSRDVLPILARSCFSCHGQDAARREADLRLDRRDSAIADRDGVRAIEPGQVERSEAWRRIHSSDPEQVMPPPGDMTPLSQQEREVLRRWIAAGAEYQPHWAFIAPHRHSPPRVPEVPSAIDLFVADLRNEAGLSAAPRGERAVLLRRVTLDLTGLPPTPDELQAFLSDTSPDAWRRTVDRLLASPHFGERWARWWLDLAHYADSDGYLQDFLRPQAWRYRQWVVDALNNDMPFDQFTVEQLAGDLLPDATISQRMGTGFLRNTLSNREGGADLEEFRVRQVVDRTQMLGIVWLGLSVGCAECHDHKFDPISQREFYQLYAFFNDADEVNIDAPLRDEGLRYAAARQAYEARRRELLAPVAAEVAELQARWESRIVHAELHPGADHRWDRQREVLGLVWGQGLGEGQLEGLQILKTPASRRSQTQAERLTDYFLKNGELVDPGRFAELQLASYSQKLEQLAQTLPPISRAPAMTCTPTPRATHIHHRGDFRRRGDHVLPGTPALFDTSLAGAANDRLQLARWLTHANHPLTSRVLVNRLWQELFGQGLVTTSENFGIRGGRPSHPQLLDWLARDLVQSGWSIKQTLRRLVQSETYQQSSAARKDSDTRDPRNKLLARQARLRLSAELIRDAGLAASGLLDRRIGGPSVRPPQPASVSMEGFDNRWEASSGADRYRRGIYTFLQRTSPYAQLVTFDLPDLSRACTRRERSNTPLQSLTQLNDPVFVEMAHALGARIRREARASDPAGAGSSDESILTRGFLLTLQREPTAGELVSLTASLQRQRAIFTAQPAEAHRLLAAASPDGRPTAVVSDAEASEEAAWTLVASVLLNLDEFIVRD